MKPGYKILIGLSVAIVAYNFYSSKEKVKEGYVKEVNSILTDIRREDYFKIQNQLAPKLASTISIDDIKSFTQSLAIKKDYKFILKDYSKDKNLLKIEGIVVNQNKELPLELTLKEDNKSFFILKEKIGTFELEGSGGNLLVGSVDGNGS